MHSKSKRLANLPSNLETCSVQCEDGAPALYVEGKRCSFAPPTDDLQMSNRHVRMALKNVLISSLFSYKAHSGERG